MTNPMKPVAVRILDKEYRVACPEGQQEALVTSARRVDYEMRKVRDSGKVLSNDRIAVLVALNLAHELMQISQSMPPVSTDEASSSADLLEQLQQLQTRLDDVLSKYNA